MTWILDAGALGTAWLATYFLHSTLLLGSAYVLARALSRRPEWVESIWKVALVGGLLTATAQTGLGISPLGGTLSIGGEAGPPAPAAPAPAERGTELETLPVDTDTAVGFASPSAAAPPAPAGAPTESRADAEPSVWPAAIFAGWLAVAGLLAAGLVAGWRRLGHALAARGELGDPEVGEELFALRRASGYAGRLRVSTSTHLPAPIAFGVGRPEICIPSRAFSDLSRDQRSSLLAHELAHVARRDPAWRLAAAAISRVFFVQPLNFLAARQLEVLSELACDDFAAEHTQRPLAVADCIAEVASWAVSPRLPEPAAAMARGRSPLKARVVRLVDGGGTQRPLRARRGALAIPALAVGVCALAAPVVAGPETPNRPELGESLTASPKSPSDAELARMAERAVAPGAARDAEAPAVADNRDKDDRRGTPVPPRSDTRSPAPDAPAPPAAPRARPAPPAPSPAEIGRMIPSEEELRRSIPSEEDIRRMIPSEEELRKSIPSEEDIRRMIPSEEELRKSIPSEEDIRRMIREEMESSRGEPTPAAGDRGDRDDGGAR